MKYVIVIPEGAADEGQVELDGLTPLVAAKTPALDRLALAGRLGTAAMTPRPLSCTDDVSLMSLLGLDPTAFPCGPAVLEAAGCGQPVRKGAPALRLSLITVRDGELIDLTAGRIGDAEAAELIADLEEAIGRRLGAEAAGLSLAATGGHRGIMIDETGRSYEALTTHPPSRIVDRPIRRYLPAGEHGELMRRVIDVSAELFAEHEINLTRQELGELPATHAWPWGPGSPLQLPPFASRFGGLRGLMICAHPLPAGLARLVGWDVILLDAALLHVQAGEKAIEALGDHDIVCVHDPSPDAAAHQGDVIGKVEALAALDEQVITPIADRLERYDAWRMLVMGTHYTSSASRRHEDGPVPLMMTGARIDAVLKATLSEDAADAADLHVDVGSDLIEYFLFGSGIGRRHDG
ncbi:MAG: hypothetical protein SYC29_15065 [Planctomycetota bacterium]|nr:hypothetical protein [Planctomycetota bacterium]